jgi:hypothetical protein
MRMIELEPNGWWEGDGTARNVIVGKGGKR